MVLHNDKWDKKAKKQYMHKHGIRPSTNHEEKPKVKKHFVQNEYNRQQPSSDDEEDTVTDEDKQFPVLNDSNVGIFLKETSANEDIQDASEVTASEVNDEDDAEEQEESQDDLSDYGIDFNRVARKPTDNLSTGHKKFDKLSSSDLIGIKIGGDGKAMFSSSQKNIVREMTAIEKEEALLLQKETAKAKEYQHVKFKFSDDPKYEKKKAKVLDLTNKDAYNERLEAKLRKAQGQTRSNFSEQDFDEDLNALLGDTDTKSRADLAVKDSANESKDFNLDELLTSNIADLKIKSSIGNSDLTWAPAAGPSKTDEDFLNDLL